MLLSSLVLALCPNAPLMYWGVQAGEKDSVSTTVFNNYNTVTSGRPGSNNRNQLIRIHAISSTRAPLTPPPKKNKKTERSQQATQLKQ